MKEKGIAVLPIAYDALSARLIEKVGFPAFSIGGFGIAASRFGLPDIGLITQTEVVQAIKDIASTVEIPLIADGETGYGGLPNLARTMVEYEKAGAAGILLEDQVLSRRCGHMVGKQVVSREEGVARIKIAVASRQDKDFFVIARTDSRATHGLKEAVKRGRLYCEAGADAIFIEAPQTIEELKTITQSLKGIPLVANMLEGGKTPILTTKELEKLGFKIVGFPLSILLASAFAVEKVLRLIRDSGTTLSNRAEMFDFRQLNNLLDLEKFLRVEKGKKGKHVDNL